MTIHSLQRMGRETDRQTNNRAYETKHNPNIIYTDRGNARTVERRASSDTKNMDENERNDKGKRDFLSV